MVKYTMSPTFTSTLDLVQLSNILPAHTATTLHLDGFSFEESGSTIQLAVFCSSSTASIRM
ncbi:MAG: hypothetical protein ACOZBL_04085 [Patescibacteria group bacterium]